MLDYPLVLVAPCMVPGNHNVKLLFLLFIFIELVVWFFDDPLKPIFILLVVAAGDEIDCLGDSWCFLLWSSDLSPSSTHSTRSRFPICILPASLYMIVDGINLTIEAMTLAIKNSFNKLASEGLKIRNLPSLGGGIVALASNVWRKTFGFCNCCPSWTCKTMIQALDLTQYTCVAQVSKIRLFVMGFRGDWKAMVMIFNLNRHYSTNKVW